MRLDRFALRASAIAVIAGVFAFGAAQAALPPSLPQVTTPPSGDPRLEAIPGSAVELVNVSAFGDEKSLTMAFPPRVNGQNQSDGDRHADLWVLFNSVTGAPINQLPVAETMPFGAGTGVTDLSARMFSSTWAVHALLVDPAYDPANLSTRIDSAAKVATSPLVVNDYQTNIFVNAPLVPNGTVADAPSPQPMQAFANGQTITLVPNAVDDGAFGPQTLFRFVDPSGQVLGAPYLVASHIPGDPFYSPVWEVVSVNVPSGFNVNSIRSLKDVQDGGFSTTNAQIRVDAPVLAIGGTAVNFVSPLSLLTDSNGHFNAQKFPFTRAATATNKRQSFAITNITAGGAGLPPQGNQFPLVANGDKGNVIPLILSNPLQLQNSGPNSSGPNVRIEQPALDSARAQTPSQLPSTIEANFTQLINAGLLDPSWAPGAGHSYQERLSLVGQALTEFVWQTPQGANPKDVTGCSACHSQPMIGGSARGSFTLDQKINPALKLNAGSMWGSGSEELLFQQLKAAGVKGLPLLGPHGGNATIPSIRSAIAGATNKHFGMQSTETVASKTGNRGGVNKTTDLDGDGVANELSAGEVTAMTVFLMTLPTPDEASAAAKSHMGISDSDVQAGKHLFRRSIDNGGAGCASCHTVFQTLSGNTFQIRNPETSSAMPITVPTQSADQADVNDGLAQNVGQMGLRLYGDMRLHKLGSKDTGSGTDKLKTAELWDTGSTAPYLRDGSAADLPTAIQAHSGVALSGIGTSLGAQYNKTVLGQKISGNVLTIQNNSGASISASSSHPIRVVLTGVVTPGVTVSNGSAGPAGSLRQGAFWLIKSSIPNGGSATLNLEFVNPSLATLQYGLAIQNDAGHSEAVASIDAFNTLTQTQQNQIVTFLRAQLIDDYVGEQ